MKQRKMRLFIVTGISILSLCSMSTVQGESPKDGLYFGLQFVNNRMSGDFDNSVFYTTSTEVFDVPDVDDGYGIGFILGLRANEIGALELGYQRSMHDTSSTFVDIGDQEAAYNVFDINFKIDVFPQDELRPYFLIGLGIPWMTIDDSSTDGFSYDDETFTGLALNVGGGVAYYFHPQWAVTGGIIYRWNRFSEVESIELDDSLSQTALSLTIGINFTF